ncbi:MAG: ACT domain-containing protein [Ruminococcus sp.]|nr:ACT domain-containing protein [Ruminococcus sp.]
MTVKQLSVFVENRAGRLSTITRLLGDNGINIRAMSIADTKDFGILRLIVNDSEKALEVLKANSYAVTCTNVLALRLSDKPGGLADAMTCLYKDNISVEYMYAAFISETEETAYLILRTDKTDEAVTALTEGGFKLVSDEEMRSL